MDRKWHLIFLGSLWLRLERVNYNYQHLPEFLLLSWGGKIAVAQFVPLLLPAVVFIICFWFVSCSWHYWYACWMSARQVVRISLRGICICGLREVRSFFWCELVIKLSWYLYYLRVPQESHGNLAFVIVMPIGTWFEPKAVLVHHLL